MKANKHLLLWSSLGTLLVLMYAAFHESYLQDWRRVQRHIQMSLPRDQAAAFHVQLRQVVATDVKATDRCVSCHVGMAPGETGIEGSPIYGKHVNVVHDTNNFGCVVCHGGQGRATTTEDAHGNVEHWPEPMIPKAYSYAGCGSCHTHLAVPNYAALQRGRALFERYDCLACHRMDGRGGTLRPGGAGGLEGPDLSAAGLHGYDSEWYTEHLNHSKAAAQPAPATTKAIAPTNTIEVWRSAFGEVPPDELDALNVYLNSRVGAPGLVEGKALFHSLGCRGCHKVGGVGGDDGPELTRVGQKNPVLTPYANVTGPHTLDNWFKQHFRSPARVVAGSQMPQLGLNEEQIDQLTFYMFSLRRGNFAESLWPKDRLRAERLGSREFSIDGATIFGTFCAACHGPNGEGMRYVGMSVFPAIGNPDFQRVASDEFITATVQRGRPGRRMPAWGEKEGGLRPEEISAVVSYVRGMGAPFEGDNKPRNWAQGNAAAGKVLFSRNCSLCHGDNGEGKEGPALNNPVLLKAATDSYLMETIRVGRRNTTMGGFGEGSTVRQALTSQDIESIIVFIRTWEAHK